MLGPSIPSDVIRPTVVTNLFDRGSFHGNSINCYKLNHLKKFLDSN
jgi:hypothetical protein